MSRSLSIGIFLASAIHMMGGDSTSPIAIGLVSASGEFTIDGSWTRDNSTVFNSSVISTDHAASHIVLADGTRIDMGMDSRGQIYRDHVTIAHGVAQVNTSNRYAVFAGKIRTDSPGRTLVRVSDSHKVGITALQGATEVKDGRGILVAIVRSGETLEFSGADTSSDDAAVVGCLERIESRSGDRVTVHYVVQDETTHVIVELVGRTDLDRWVGWTVGATGLIDTNIKPISPATSVVRVRDLNASSLQRCRGPLGAPPQPPPPPVHAAAPGLSTLAKVEIIAGVAVGGTISGLLGTGVIGGGGAALTPSPTSR